MPALLWTGAIMIKPSALEKAYAKYGAGSPQHIKALKAYEKRVYGGYVSKLTIESGKAVQP